MGIAKVKGQHDMHETRRKGELELTESNFMPVLVTFFMTALISNCNHFSKFAFLYVV